MTTSQDIISQNTSETDNRTPFEIANERMNEQIENFSGIMLEEGKILGISYDPNTSIIRFEYNGTIKVVEYEGDPIVTTRLIKGLGTFVSYFRDEKGKETVEAYIESLGLDNETEINGRRFKISPKPYDILFSELPVTRDSSLISSDSEESKEVQHTLGNLYSVLAVPLTMLEVPTEYDTDDTLSKFSKNFAAFLRITEFLSLAWGGDKRDHDPQVPFEQLKRIIDGYGKMKQSDGTINYIETGEMPREESFLRILDILELVNNAQKMFKKREGDGIILDKSIKVAVNNVGDDIVYSVSDTAKGMERDKVQSRFEEGNSGRGSTGLGLNLLLHNASAAGGSVRVSSTDSKGRYAVKVTLNKDGQVVVEDLAVEPDFEASEYDTTIDIIIPNAEASENT